MYLYFPDTPPTHYTCLFRIKSWIHVQKVIVTLVSLFKN